MSRLQKVLLKLDETGYSKIRTKVNALDEQIKEVVWEFEDLLESHVYQQILPQLESSGDHMAAIFVDLQSLQQSVDCFVERVKAMEAEYDIELLNMPDEEGEPLSSRIDCSGINSKMVRIPDDFGLVRDVVLAEDEENCCGIIGMAGVGKTTFAKKVFDDPLVREHFEHRAWVKVGKKCESNETLKCILAQLDPNTQGRDGYDDEKLAGILEERLKDKQCLIVLDDVWEWDTRMIANLPQENVRILFTSRLNTINSSGVRVNLLDEEESKKLLGEKVFGEEGFPPHLEKLGEIIANKCEGLPLMLVTVGELLSKEDKTPEFWTEVAGKKHNSIFVDAYSQISEVIMMI
ncbi:disease resistance protein RPH8A-like [Salvia hispanica]|uniref:disease resistance protein RPH8A-like n=1 Tax=Salvia hispanica TaxID=49212 RepID=UPI0020098827|nr:disease resistance protein RPH8A-like [Salvia hispanica]